MDPKSSSSVLTDSEVIEIIGAREHNLKNVTLAFPRHKLVVITGISGSGKSSLAFDTLYAEGQRRYLESFSAYARGFIGNLERPQVDKINGLSPVISIEQKTTTRNPRSTVGTVTEIYDFMRLLFARTAKAYSYITGNEMIRQSEDQIVAILNHRFKGKTITLLAPVVKGRKGHYRELFVRLRQQGYTKVRVDGQIQEIKPKMQLDRFKIHDVEVIIDHITVDHKQQHYLVQSVQRALKEGGGILIVVLPSGKTHYYSKHLMEPETGLSYPDPAPNTFSFNSHYGACPACEGLGVMEQITQASIIPDENISISQGGIIPLGSYRDIWIFKKIEALLKKYRVSLSTPIKKLPQEILHRVLYGDDVRVQITSLKNPETKWETKFEGIIPFLKKQKEEGSAGIQNWVDTFVETIRCPECKGARLKKESLFFKLADKNIAELSHLNMVHLADWVEHLPEHLSDRQRYIATEILKEIHKRIRFLLDVGLDYLQLDRPIRTLSGGEAQRIRLAAQIGTQLVGVLYILDEPSIGLHARDNMKLIHTLQNLRDLGNSVIIVEHDKEMMLASDYIIDIGPGAGLHGGQIVAQGTPEKFLKSKTITADYLSGKRTIAHLSKRRQGSGKEIILEGATGNNLKNITFRLPLGTFTCITGVSGSGKSSLIHDTLYPILTQHFYRSMRSPLPYKEIHGLSFLDKVVEVDQSPIGRTPRSNPATYTGVFSDIRQVFVQLPESKIRGYKAGRFSFNVKGGRCNTCEGNGLRAIEMDFLPTVYVSCEACKGKRYNRETLEVCFKGKSISDVLEMTVEEAVSFFESHPSIWRKLEMLKNVGLGYISLGQHATTLSGGEAQRVKLATELSRRDTGKTLYILDEPTTGLHFQDIQHLLDVLHQLVDKGNTVLVIEHNMDIIKGADFVVDLGPEGGDGGGHLVGCGTPEHLAQNLHNGYTGQFLQVELNTAQRL